MEHSTCGVSIAMAVGGGGMHSPRKSTDGHPFPFPPPARNEHNPQLTKDGSTQYSVGRQRTKKKPQSIPKNTNANNRLPSHVLVEQQRRQHAARCLPVKQEGHHRGKKKRRYTCASDCKERRSGHTAHTRTAYFWRVFFLPAIDPTRAGLSFIPFPPPEGIGPKFSHTSPPRGCRFADGLTDGRWGA